MAVVMIVSGLGGLFLTQGTAAADVDSVRGTGYGIAAFVGGAAVIPPTPDPNVNPPLLEANESSTDFGPRTSSVITIGGIANILANGVAVGPVVTQAGNIVGENHGGFIATNSQVANVSILGDSVNIPLIQTTCVSNGDGSTGTTSVSNARLGPLAPLLNGPVGPNTVVNVAGLLTVTLNEQVITNLPPSGGQPGSTSIRVRGAVIRIPADGSVAEIILAEAFCQAVGPDVLLPPTTAAPTTAAPTTAAPTTAAPTTAAPTTAAPTTAAPTTAAPTTAAPTTAAPTTAAPTTSTTAPPTGTIASTTTTTVAGVVTTVRSGVLVRTGSSIKPLAMLSMLSIVLGILMLIGSGRPLAANAGTGAGSVGVPGAGPEKWGPVEVGKTIWAGFAMLIMGPGELISRRRRRADDD